MLKQYCLSASLLLLTACASSPQNYIKPTQSFAIAVGEFSESYKDYVNEYYYNQPLSLMRDVAFAPDTNIKEDSIDTEKYIPCNIKEQSKCITVTSFLREGLDALGSDDYTSRENQVKAHFALADSLKKYSIVLLQISQTDISGDFVAATHSLGHSLRSLQSTIESTFKSKSNLESQETIGALAGAIGAIGGQIIKEKQAKILRDTILNDDEILSKIFEIMNENIKLFSLGITNIQNGSLKYYLSNAKKDNKEMLQKRFNALRENENIFTDIRRIHSLVKEAKDTLVKAANDDKKVDNIEEVSISLQEVSYLSDKIKKAVQSLNN